MLTALLIATSILLALSGLALIKLSNAYTALNAEYDSLLEEAAQDDATIDQLRARYFEREQELLCALEDATKAADDNEWLYNDANQCYAEAIDALKDAEWTIETMQREYAELQQQLKATVEGYSTAEAEQAAEIADQNEIIEGYQTEIHHKVNRIAELKDLLKRATDYWSENVAKVCELQDELLQVTEQRDHLMADRIEAIAHMKEQNDQLRQYMTAYDAACAELDEAIEAAAPQEDIVHIEDKKVWCAIGEWTRLIVYASSKYHCYIQKGIDGPIKRLAAADLTEAQRTTFNALKTAVKSI